MTKTFLAAAAIALACGSAAFAQAGDPTTMKCVEYSALSVEGKAQLVRAYVESTGGGNELDADVVRKLDNVCPTNPEMTVADAAAQQ